MKCPNCGAARLVHDVRDLPYTYKGESTVLPQVAGDFCLACGESVLDATESRRVSASMRKLTLVKVLDRHPDLLAEVRAS